jgi:hypothetical protein
MSGAIGIAQVIDLVIVATLAESLVLTLYHRRTGRGVAPRAFLLNMVSGLCLMFALRCLANDSRDIALVLWLLTAGLAHGGDIWMRWQGRAARADRNTRQELA